MDRGWVSLAGLLCAALVLVSPEVSGQIHKDTRRGFSVKPPRGYNAVALKPSEFIVVAKYQSDKTDYGGAQGSTSLNATFEVQFFPISTENSEAEEPGAALLAMGNEWLEARHGYYETIKEREVKIGKVKARELHIRPSDDSPVTVYVALLPQEDGLYLFEGAALAERFSKYANDFTKAARSFKRIDKDVEETADDEQLDPQERYLKAQIDKLPPGWSSLRTDRYLFLYNAEKTFVKQMGDRIEAFRNEYEKLYPPTEPITAVSIVRVCNSADEYYGYGGSKGSGGYWNPRDRELVFFDKAPRTETLCVLNHEAFHQYIYYYYGELSPHSWYNEGHGDYFSGARVTKTYRITSYKNAPGGFDRQQFIKDMVRLARQGKSVEEGAAAPMKELMNYSQREYYARGPTRPVAFYPQGWAVVHMLRESGNLEPEWESILPEYLENLVAARHEVAEALRDKTLSDAEKREEGASADLDQEVEDYYGRIDQRAAQVVAFEKTFATWDDADWAAFDQAFWDYVEKL